MSKHAVDERRADSHPCDTVRAAAGLLARVRELHKLAYIELTRAAKSVKTGKLACDDSVDLGLVIREIVTLIDDTRKEGERLLEVITNVTCLQTIQQGLTSPETASLTVRGRLGNGAIDVEYGAVLPKRGEPGYADMCVALGLSSDAIDADLFRLHWPTVVAVVTSGVRSGELRLPGVDPSSVFPRYRLHLRRRPDAAV